MASRPESEPDPEQIGRYRVLRPLGSGGVGVVYAAHDPELQRDVAVKLLRRGTLVDRDASRAQARLKGEAQVMARLAHPNVATVFDVGTHGDAVYIAMELVDGPSLRDWIDRTARTWREVLSMYFHAGRGLVAAHGAGIVHRDFKPANVLVGRDGRPRVVDFGLASPGPVQGRPFTGDVADVLETDPGQRGRITDIDATSSGMRSRLESTVDVLRTSPGDRPLRETTDVLRTLEGLDITGDSIVGMLVDSEITVETGVTRSGVVAGTPAYMAPEMFTGGRADERTDQFAFAVALYEGLYGERPFAGDTAAALAMNVIDGRVRPVPRGARVPGWIRDILLRGLAVDPRERHESVRSMLASIAFLGRVFFE
jgi:eukaryotic-like serine/threonine-protein kinase